MSEKQSNTSTSANSKSRIRKVKEWLKSLSNNISFGFKITFQAFLIVVIPVFTINFIRAWHDDKYYMNSFQLPDKFTSKGISSSVAINQMAEFVSQIQNSAQPTNIGEGIIREVNTSKLSLSVSEVVFEASMTKLVNIVKSLLGYNTNLIDVSVLENDENHYSLVLNIPGVGVRTTTIETNNLSEFQITHLLGIKAGLLSMEILYPISCAKFFNQWGNQVSAKEICYMVINNINSSEQDRLEAQAELGASFANQGDIQTGIKILKRVIKENHSHHTANFYLAQIYLNTQNYQSADSLFKILQSRDNKNSYFSVSRAFALYQLGNNAEALSIVKKAYEVDSKNFYILELYGSLLASEREFFDASKLLSKFEELYPDAYLDPRYAPNWQKAGDSFKYKYIYTAISSANNDSTTYYSYKKALSLDPSSFWVRRGLAESAYVRKENTYVVLSLISEAEKLYPSAPSLRTLKMQCHDRNNQTDDTYIKEILDGLFYSNQLNINYWNEFVKRLKSEDSRIDYLFALGEILFPNNIEFLKTKQAFFNRIGDDDKLLSNTHKLIEADGSNKKYLTDLIKLYHKRQDFIPEAECVHRLSQQNPSDCYVLDLWSSIIELIKLEGLSYDTSIYNEAVDKSGCSNLKRF